MADDSSERTEPASEKRREEFREKGDIARSKDIISVLVLLCGLAYFLVFGGWIYRHVGGVLVYSFDLSSTIQLSVQTVHTVGQNTVWRMAILLSPLVAAIVLVSVLGNVAQVGILFTLKPLEPDLSRLNFFTRVISTFFSKQAFGQLVGSLAKVGAVAIIIWLTVGGEGQRIRSLSTLPLYSALHYIFTTCLTVLLNVCLLLVLISVADYMWNHYVIEEKMKMTRQEVKDEQKEYEGNPEQKGQQRKRARDVANQRMAAAIPTADVVVNNPTQLSVALRYRQGVDAAPVVVAKGADLMAMRIRRIAQLNDVPMVENVPLARVLYKHVKVGRPVPSKFFRAVAEVLAYVYRLRKARPRTSAAAGSPNRPRRGDVVEVGRSGGRS